MKRLKFANKLGGRIFLTFAVALIFLSLIFGFFTNHFGAQLIQRSAGNELRVLSVVLSEMIQNHFSNLEGSLDEIGENAEIKIPLAGNTVNRQKVESYLTAALIQHPHLTDLIIYDRLGRCVGSTDPDWYSIRGKNERFFKKGLEAFNFPLIYGTDSLERVQLVSAPITKGEQVVGVIVAVIELKDIYELMDQKIGLTETTDAFLLDEELRFITAGRSPNRGLVESHLASTTLASHLKDEFWVGEYAGSDGQQVIGTALRIPGYHWYVVVERDFDDVIRQMTSLQNAVILTTLGLLIIFIIASLALSRSITSPLLRLVQSTRLIAAGKYNEPVVVTDEIEEVAFIGTELERMRRRIAISQERLKERLSESEQLRLESERLAAIGTLAASLAHEIRNPLNAMSLLLSRLQYLSNDETRQTVMSDLFSEIARLDRLVSSILDYARPIQITRRPVDIQAILNSMGDMYRSIAESKGVNLVIEPGPELIKNIDQDRVKQCLVNLVRNALDAASRGGTIHLKCSDRHHEQSELCIEVSDDGVGIPMEIQRKLFSPFFTTKEHGTGLGLSAVQKIVTAHGGRIDVVSDPEKSKHGNGPRGTKFLLIFPT